MYQGCPEWLGEWVGWKGSHVTRAVGTCYKVRTAVWVETQDQRVTHNTISAHWHFPSSTHVGKVCGEMSIYPIPWHYTHPICCHLEHNNLQIIYPCVAIPEAYPLHLIGDSHFSQCYTTDVTKAVVCVILSVGWCISKTLAANWSSPCGGSRFTLAEWSFTMSDAI